MFHPRSSHDFDVGNFAKALEERAKFVLSAITRKASTKHGDLAWVIELIHRHKLVHRYKLVHGHKMVP